MERPALQRQQTLAHELGAAVDDARRLGAVLAGPNRHPVEVGLVVLAEVGGVGVRDGAALTHPRHGRRRVEPAGEGDADALAGGSDVRTWCVITPSEPLPGRSRQLLG